MIFKNLKIDGALFGAEPLPVRVRIPVFRVRNSSIDRAFAAC